MKLDLFSTPIWIGNIDASKVKLVEQQLRPTFESKVNTTFNEGFGSKIQESSLEYLLTSLVSILDETIKLPYKIYLENIWENSYNQEDFQEKHTHPGSDLSFVIYKKVEQANTVFVNPADKLLDAYYIHCKRKQDLFGCSPFAPKCRENQIIIFPSYLEHYVKKTSNSVTISGNLKLNFDV